MSQTSRLWAIALIVLGIGLGLNAFKPAASPAQLGGGQIAGRFTVIDTEGTNLIVTDNTSETLYFYTVDPEKAPGEDLKLRGELSLRDVGKPILKPKIHKHEK
jgi:hypothetical protein